MVRLPPAQVVEVFHLAFLRLLEARLGRAQWVVKGGVNLRTWFGSPRTSEDLDLDVIAGEAHELMDTVDRLLSARAFQDLLKLHDITLERASKPKQTETTQRWKLALRSPASQVPIPTKIELSRRGADGDFVFEPARADVVRQYSIPAPTANHYTATAALRQKIRALAGRREPQARDIWDIDHLLRTTGAEPHPLPPALQKVLPVALDRVLELPFEAFAGQVVPYLPPEQQEIFATRTAWDRMRELVVDTLLQTRR
jgi:hypothetical protein